MNPKKYRPIKPLKSSLKTKKPTKKGSPSKKNLSFSSIEQSLNLTETSVEPQNETFIFQPNQESDHDESEIEFIATEKSYIEDQLTQDMELEIFKTLKENESKNPSKLKLKNKVEKQMYPEERSAESIQVPKQFKNTRNFKKSLDFEVKNKLNTSVEQLIISTPKNSNPKPVNIPPEKKTINPTLSDSEEEIFVPQKARNIEPEVNPERKIQNLQPNSRPAKRLKMDQFNKDQCEVTFSVDIKLLNPGERVSKVIRFGNSGQVTKSSDALYVVEVEGKKEQRTMNDVEMTHFYKDPLIDFYQGLHFD